MSAKGRLRTRRFKRVSFFDVISGMIFGVFVKVRILQRVQSKSCLAKSYRKFFFRILCFVGRASRYTCVMKTNLMHYLSSVYLANQPLHVSGIFVAHHQEVYLYIYKN